MILKMSKIMNKRLLFFVFFLFGLLLSGNMKAQDVIKRSTDITKIGGKEYYMHLVKTGQTLYGISKAYNVTIEELEMLNPELKNGLKAGHILGIPVRPVAEPQVEEPNPVVVEPMPEPEPEPVVVVPEPTPVPEPEPEPQPEPVVVEPEPQPVAVEPVPVPEPVAVEPEPEPMPEPEPVVVEPIPDPEPVVVEPEPEPIVQEPVVEETVIDHKTFFDGSGRVVQQGEDLYDIAKEYGIDIADFKVANPRLSDEPAAGTRIVVPNIANENDYIVHQCDRNERVASLLKRWKVDESVFRAKNVSVGSHVFSNQVVLIPIEPITDFYWVKESENVVVEEIEEPEMVEVSVEQEPTEQQSGFDFWEEMGEAPVCVADPANARQRYHVALMVPLYLNDVSSLEVSKENLQKAQKSRALSFLQFYEGFMMAVEAMDRQGMKLDLDVIDVTDNVASAEKALRQIQNEDLDLIVGPFFGKSFAVIEEYAKNNGIAVVNPLSTRESVIKDSPNVVKVKPGDMGLIMTLSNLVKNYYADANVFIVSREKAADTAFLNQLEHHLNHVVNEEVLVSGDEFLQYARHESERLEMGSRLAPTLDVEGQVYSTRDFQDGNIDHVVMANTVKRYAYGDISKLKSQLSGVRTNLIIAYGDDNVFATQMLNSLTKEADQYPITLVCAPDWAKFEKLLVENLLKMNAIYVSDHFVDYDDDEVKRFVARFRSKYAAEPQKYAFEGYDVGRYFLNALMQYGSDDLVGCLHCYQAALLHTNYRYYYRNYLDSFGNEGKENLYWSVYQYDNEGIELVPIDPFKKNLPDE